jgi:hypothetical protein
LAALTGLPLRAHTAHEMPPGGAAALPVWAVAPSREDILAKVVGVATGHTWRPILGLAIDGAKVPPRPETATGQRPGRQQGRAKRARWPGEWREAPGFRVARLADDRMVSVVSWHQLHTDEAAATALRPVQGAGLSPEAHVRLCVIADGARWLWKQAQALLPSAVELLDDDHCSEHLHTVAMLPYGAYPERQQEWCEAARARLCDGEVQGRIWGLQRRKPTKAQAAQARAPLLRDLERHQARLDDRCARQGGSPIGSGGRESANTCIGHVRRTRSGAWWDCDYRQPHAGFARRAIQRHL